jgi:DNA-binding MarR family transcriptional regulator
LGDESLIAILGEIGKGVLLYEQEIRKKLGLSLAEYKGILCIDEGDKITCQEFSKRLNLSVSRGSRIVDRLCRRGYIGRTDCASDRRCKNIWLTREGIEIHRLIMEEIQNMDEILTSGYPHAKIMLLKSDLKRLCQKL